MTMFDAEDNANMSPKAEKSLFASLLQKCGCDCFLGRSDDPASSTNNNMFAKQPSPQQSSKSPAGNSFTNSFKSSNADNDAYQEIEAPQSVSRGRSRPARTPNSGLKNKWKNADESDLARQSLGATTPQNFHLDSAKQSLNSNIDMSESEKLAARRASLEMRASGDFPPPGQQSISRGVSERSDAEKTPEQKVEPRGRRSSFHFARADPEDSKQNDGLPKKKGSKKKLNNNKNRENLS